MSAPGRDTLQAYADGVNAYLEGRPGAEISLEYAVLGLQNSGYVIEPWSPVDTLTWPKMMAWDLGGNMGAEIARAILGQDLAPDRVEQLYPPMPDDKPVIVESGSGLETGASPPSLPDGAGADGEHGPMPWSREGVDALSTDVLELIPPR